MKGKEWVITFQDLLNETTSTIFSIRCANLFLNLFSSSQLIVPVRDASKTALSSREMMMASFNLSLTAVLQHEIIKSDALVRLSLAI